MSTSNSMAILLSNRTYDILKYVAQIVLPALGALYFGLSQIWGFPNGEEVVGTLAIITVFLGAVLGLSSNAYSHSDARFDGTIDIDDSGEETLFSLNLDGDPYELPQRDEVVFRVHKGPLI
jgi:hypothetical protein